MTRKSSVRSSPSQVLIPFCHLVTTNFPSSFSSSSPPQCEVSCYSSSCLVSTPVGRSDLMTHRERFRFKAGTNEAPLLSILRHFNAHLRNKVDVSTDLSFNTLQQFLFTAWETSASPLILVFISHRTRQLPLKFLETKTEQV